MDRPYNASTPTACVFIDILKRLPQKPNTNSTADNSHMVGAKPNNIKVSGYNSEVMITILRLPNRATSQPENGRLIINPTGKANNTAPRPASLNKSFVLISGMRLAQEENVKPAIKKNTLTAIR